MPEYIHDQATMTITLDEVVSAVKGYTLADEDIPINGQILKAIAVARFAHEYDVQPADVEILAWDQMHKLIPVPMRDSTEAWEVDYVFCVWCDYCENVARHQTHFGSNLCGTHLHEAYEEEQAERYGDDVRAGIIT